MKLDEARRQIKTLEHYISWCSKQERLQKRDQIDHLFNSFGAPFDEYKTIFRHSLEGYTYLISETERAEHVIKFAQIQYSGAFRELRRMTGLDVKTLERNVQRIRKGKNLSLFQRVKNGLSFWFNGPIGNENKVEIGYKVVAKLLDGYYGAKEEAKEIKKKISEEMKRRKENMAYYLLDYFGHTESNPASFSTFDSYKGRDLDENEINELIVRFSKGFNHILSLSNLKSEQLRYRQREENKPRLEVVCKSYHSEILLHTEAEKLPTKNAPINVVIGNKSYSLA